MYWAVAEHASICYVWCNMVLDQNVLFEAQRLKPQLLQLLHLPDVLAETAAAQ
jgi:hypothetical protein